MTKVFNIQ